MSARNEGQVRPLLRDIASLATGLWWRFFDWVALVRWQQLALLALLLLVTGGILGIPRAAVVFILASIAVKILAGGKRRAELAARDAITRANFEALERRVLEAQIAALQAQVEPHFLFNTLALIGQLIETDPPQATRIHGHLIQYLRSALPQMREHGGSTLGRQVELARAYLAIMQARMQNRLKVDIAVPPALADAPFPPMMLQSLVENAIKHGLEPQAAGGTITIDARAAGTVLQVDVADDGIGLDPYADDGVGLANIRERLQLLFGGAARLTIESLPQGGTRASICVPYRAG
jgi:sensor histidine kinase YesM